ncbi:dCTP deaminase domain-containing protein [Spirulina sp. 06S082]|uniref:dCTP deaminase domain-containing protein n=1 Tax=Spirulina sp. 06S082 TaxID=3110248 RepID=UPI002B20B69A|nr:hypothetical protein [Spirulina sp. 06S082]MEA5467265.1 hypothetical protein [Spirulina sp. 06S082]
MSTLSDVDIKSEILKGNILIYPFQKENLKGASYNLTVSKIAYKIPANANDTWESAYNPDEQKIIIPSNSTVLIVTNETVYVNEKISGTYHSKVKQVSKGLGHISTTLDPTYLGVSVIALHNHNPQNIELEPEKDTFVSLVFRYVKTPSSVHHDNRPGRPDILPELTKNEKDWFYEGFRKKRELLEEKMNELSDVQELREKANEQQEKKKKQWSWGIPYVIYVLIFLTTVLFHIFDINDELANKAQIACFSALMVQVSTDLQRRNK